MKAVYDYDRQAWTLDGLYVKCGHVPEMQCQCYGRLHAGERAPGIYERMMREREESEEVKP
jgi:hypothetical protein